MEDNLINFINSKAKDNLGLLIDIEGADGSGKSTQAECLKTYFENMGRDVRRYHFPTIGSDINGKFDTSAIVNMYLNGDFPKEISPYIISTFYLNDMYATYHNVIKKDIEEGRIVILDRWWWSTFIYQGTQASMNNIKLKEFENWFMMMISHYQLPEPDIKIYLDLPSSYVIKHIDLRNKADKSHNYDIHEQNKNLLYNVALRGKNKVKEEKDWIEITCADLSIDEVAYEIQSHIENLIK